LVGLVREDVLESSRILDIHCREYSDVLERFPRAFIHNDTHRGNIGLSASTAGRGIRLVPNP
jgi:hypothetical protein